jgi:hypothetical protein
MTGRSDQALARCSGWNMRRYWPGARVAGDDVQCEVAARPSSRPLSASRIDPEQAE